MLALAISIAATMAAHGQSAAPAETAPAATAAATGSLRGHITDPSGALIPGTQLTVTTAKGAAVTTVTADAAGAYAVHGLPGGSYVIQATYEGFAPFVSTPIALNPGQVKIVDIKMAIEAAEQQVVVSDEGAPQVSVEAGENSNAIVLKGSDLDALSDDPDELSNELTALAGPSAGPNGGQIYIDGFTGGQLPPKSAIREIRINQNPFSAEFDRLGYGRIEILTKPGTDVLHGRFFGMGNDSSFNTGNPFTQTFPSYHSIMLNGTLSGSLSKKISFFFSVEQRNNQDASIYSARIAVQDPSTGLWYIPTDSTGSIIPTSGGVFAPATHTEISPRMDFQLGQKNTLTLRYQFFRNNVSGDIGSTSLPSQNATANTIEHTLQVSDSQIINDRIVNETRFEYRRGINSETPVSQAPTFGVGGYFSDGGSGTQYSNGHSDHLELQNITTMTAGKHAIKFGAWLRDNRQATSTDSNYNGSFSFPTLQAYVDTLNGLASGETVAEIAAACPPTSSGTPGQCTPNKLTYTTGPEAFKGNLFDAALFFQDDWKFNPSLTLSGGLRWETQNHTADHSDWGPRVAFAYALDGHKNRKQAKTVVRGGFGFFYDRFQIQDLMNLEQYNGTANAQAQTVITNPTCFDASNLSTALAQGCGSSASSSSQIDTIAPSYRAPYTEQFGASLERQLTKVSTLTFTYLHSLGVHQLVVRDSNAYEPLPGTVYYNSTTGPRPDPNLGIVDQYFPEAVFKQNQIIVNVNARFSQNFGVMGFYNWTDANSDGGGGSNPSNSYDLGLDYGRASFVRPQMLFLMGNYTGPWGLTFNPFLVAQAGKPFDVAVENDLTGDNFFNSRPSVAAASSCAPSASVSQYAQTSFGCLNTDPQPGETVLPPDIGNSPSSFAVNLRLSRSWGIGPKVESSGGPAPGDGGGPHGGGGGGRGGGRGGFGGFGGPFGGGGGGMRGGMSNTGRKYSLNFSAQALNLFNDINLGTPSGAVAPSFNSQTGITGPGSGFDVSNRLASGMFASPSGSASRRIFFQAAFQF
jgi:Carboxypeptidase regulatory-like domain